MTGPMMRGGGDNGARTSRILLILGVIVAVVSVLSWFTFHSNGNSNGNGNGNGASDSTCRVPAHGRSGAESPPSPVLQVVTALGTPAVTATDTSSGSTAYVYCYDVVDGTQLTTAVKTLELYGYDQNAGEDTTTELGFTKDGKRPYGIYLKVDGGLDISRPDPQSRGGLSVVWTDSKPAD